MTDVTIHYSHYSVVRSGMFTLASLYKRQLSVVYSYRLVTEWW